MHAAGGGGRRYQRDALGRVVAETDLATGAITRYGWDGAQRAFVRRPTGELELTVAAEGLDQPVATLYPNGARHYHHQDRQGSVYALTGDDGQPHLLVSYTAYGEPSLYDGAGRSLGATGARAMFGYHGLPHDFALGLVDLRARAYLPTLGRFLSPDPIKLAGGANLFAFVDSGPLTWRDPLGLAKRADPVLNVIQSFQELGHRFHRGVLSIHEWDDRLYEGFMDVMGIPEHLRHGTGPSLLEEWLDGIANTLLVASQCGQPNSGYSRGECQAAMGEVAIATLPAPPVLELWSKVATRGRHLGATVADDVVRGADDVASHVGGSGARRVSPLNPSGSRTNCVNSVCAFLKSVRDKEIYEASEHVAENGGEIARAIRQIEGNVGARVSRSGVQAGTLLVGERANSQTFFLVFKGMNPKQSTHVVVGLNKRGRQMIFDAQSGQWYFDLGGFGSFTAWPISF